MTKQIEVEFRALLSKKKYGQLENFLRANGQDLGEDNKELTFFLLPNKLLKVINNTSKQTAKISLKMGRFGQGHGFEETEIEIKPDEVERAIGLFENLGYKEHHQSLNRRHNYIYKEIEFALKIGDPETWSYHLEMEMLMDDPSKQPAAEDHIRSTAEQLEIKLITNDELLAFENKIKKVLKLKEN